MSVLEWKKINLLELVPYTLQDKLLGINVEITASCCNEDNIVFCDIDNNVHVFSRNFDKTTFQPGNFPVKTCSLTSDGLLVTLIQDPYNFSTFLQIYNVQKLVKQHGNARIAVARLNAFSLATTMVAATVQNMFITIIGFEKGDILSHRGQISRDISSNFQNITIGIRSIVGIQLDLRPKHSTSINMFISTNDSVFYVTLKESSDLKYVLETSKNVGCRTHCCTMHYSDKCEDAYFVVCRDDAIYCFTSDGRGPCYALEGRKKFIAWIGNNLVVIVQQKPSSVAPQPVNTLIVIDIANKIIVFYQKGIEEIGCLFSQNQGYILVTKQSKDVLILQERDLQSKLRILTRKHMYDTALHIFNSSDESMSGVTAQINMKYGNHLLQKGDISGAVIKYINTIGIVKPSDIIQKLLDSRYNIFLLQYLNALVSNECVHDEHKNLLKTCYQRYELPTQIKSEYFINQLSPTSLQRLKDENTYDLLQDENYICNNLKKVGLEKSPKDALEIVQTLVDKNVIKHPERLLSLFIADAKMGVNFLNNHIRRNTNCNYKMYNNLLAYYLSLWHQDKLGTFEILHYLQVSVEHIQPDHALTICKAYSFLPGIKQILASCREHTFGNDKRIRSLLKDTQNNPLKTSNIIIILNTVLDENPHCLLQTLQNISNNKLLKVNCVKEFFSEENLQRIIDREMPINSLSEEIIMLKILMKNFNENPIEFRNSICDVCRSELKLPSLFFLCQHSFHKECITSYNSHGMCTSCFSIKEPEPEIATSDMSNIEVISNISTLLAEGIFFLPEKRIPTSILSRPFEENSDLKSCWTGRFQSDCTTYTNEFQNKNPFEDISTNPFE